MDTETELDAGRATGHVDAAAHDGAAAREFVLTGCTAHPRAEKTHAPLETNVHDVALVFEGGGYRASYTAGIANVLLERGIYFDEVCGISAGSSHTANYISRDQNRVRRSFIDLAGIPEGALDWNLVKEELFKRAKAIQQLSGPDGPQPGNNPDGPAAPQGTQSGGGKPATENPPKPEEPQYSFDEEEEEEGNWFTRLVHKIFG